MQITVTMVPCVLKGEDLNLKKADYSRLMFSVLNPVQIWTEEVDGANDWRHIKARRRLL